MWLDSKHKRNHNNLIHVCVFRYGWVIMLLRHCCQRVEKNNTHVPAIMLLHVKHIAQRLHCTTIWRTSYSKRSLGTCVRELVRTRGRDFQIDETVLLLSEKTTTIKQRPRVFTDATVYKTIKHHNSIKPAPVPILSRIWIFPLHHAGNIWNKQTCTQISNNIKRQIKETNAQGWCPLTTWLFPHPHCTLYYVVAGV